MTAPARITSPKLPTITAEQLARFEAEAIGNMERLAKKAKVVRFELTPRRKQVVHAAALMFRTFRRFPTFRELGAATGMCVSKVHEHLEALVWLGYISKSASESSGPGKRLYGITDAGMELAFGRCCPCCGKAFSEVSDAD